MNYCSCKNTLISSLLLIFKHGTIKCIILFTRVFEMFICVEITDSGFNILWNLPKFICSIFVFVKYHVTYV